MCTALRFLAASAMGHHILQPGLAVAGGVGKDRYMGPATSNNVLHHIGGLDGVARRGSKDVAFRGRVLGGQGCAGGAGDDQWQFGILKYLQ